MNNTGGVVMEAVHVLAQHTCRVETMFDIDIHHMLLVKPGTKKEDVITITSHVQALRQCTEYLEANWLHAEVISYRDTAQAAADLAAGVLTATTAVLAPRRSAELYGLEVLAASVQDNPHNKTTFVVVKK